MRLLVVEDEHSLREDIARKLRLSGYEVDACADGEAALEALAAERYDLVLLDLNLPKVDGMQVLRTLRRHDLETCVLILSARSEIADKVEGLDAGANDYLSKPFHLAELEARVRSLTRRKFIQGCLPVLRTAELQHPQPRCCCGRSDPCFDAEGERRTGISAAASGPPGQSGRAHRARLGRQRRQFQQLHPGAYLCPAQKLRAALGYDPIRNRIGAGYEIGGEVQ